MTAVSKVDSRQKKIQDVNCHQAYEANIHIKQRIVSTQVILLEIKYIR